MPLTDSVSSNCPAFSSSSPSFFSCSAKLELYYTIPYSSSSFEFTAVICSFFVTRWKREVFVPQIATLAYLFTVFGVL